MYNKKTLLQAMAELNKAKAPKKSKDVITDPRGQWEHPGEITRIPSSNITMKGVDYPVLGISNTGQQQMMQPGGDYTFPGADYVDEYPQMRKGGQRKKRKTKSIMGKNKLMEIGPLFKDYSKRIFDPNVNYFQDGGMYMDLTDDEIEEYRRGGYIVEDISVPELNQAQKGHITTSKGKDGTVTNKFLNANGDTVVQVKTKDGKYYEKVKPELPQFIKNEFKKRADWENRSSGAAQPVDDFWTLPIGMTSAGVKTASGIIPTIAKGLKSELAQTAKAGTKAFFNKSRIKSLPGSSWGNLLTSSGIVSGIGSYFDKDSNVRKSTKKAIENPTTSNIIKAIGEHSNNALDFIGVGMGNKLSKVPKYINKLGKYSKIPASLKKSKPRFVNIQDHIDEFPYNYDKTDLINFTDAEKKADFIKKHRSIEEKSNEYFNTLLNSKELSDEDIDLISQYMHDSGAFTGRFGNLNKDLQDKLESIIVGNKGQDIYATRHIGDPEKWFILNDAGHYEPGHPLSFSAGLGSHSPLLNTGAGRKNRILVKIPKEQSVLINPYKKLHADHGDSNDSEELLETLKKERELILPRNTKYKPIGEKQKNIFGGYDYYAKIIDPYKKGGMVLELTPNEIEEYIKQGYTVEDVD